MKNWYNKQTKELFCAILLLRSEKEAKNFFRDLLTEAEIFEFTKRWQAAKMLNENAPYLKIEKETGLSSRTIARIAKWLDRGTGGYKLMIKKTSKHQHAFSPKGRGLR